jgi:hypothetical protein
MLCRGTRSTGGGARGGGLGVAWRRGGRGAPRSAEMEAEIGDAAGSGDTRRGDVRSEIEHGEVRMVERESGE